MAKIRARRKARLAVFLHVKKQCRLSSEREFEHLSGYVETAAAAAGVVFLICTRRRRPVRRNSTAYGGDKEKFCGAVDWLIKLIPIYRRTRSGTVRWKVFW